MRRLQHAPLDEENSSARRSRDVPRHADARSVEACCRVKASVLV
jgi:hypothetical protein